MSSGKRIFDKTRQICYNGYKAYCTKTVGGSNLPPEMEVSNMSVETVVAILTLIVNIVELVFDICNNKKK